VQISRQHSGFPEPLNFRRSITRGFLACCALLLFASFTIGRAVAQRAEPEPDLNVPVARILTIASPLSDETVALVRRTLLELEQLAQREQRKGYLILEISPGVSSFHHCYALADFLTEQPWDHVTTVAWVPETVTGLNGLVALSCREIVLGSKASLGDLGNGGALPVDQQNIVRALIDRRRNSRVSLPLVNAMMDPDSSLIQLTVETATGVKENRLATTDEARQLQEQGTVILDRSTVSESGTPTLISSSQARSRDLLATGTAASRQELLDIYHLSLDQLREMDPPHAVGKVAYIEMHDVIDEVFAAFVTRHIQHSVNTGAKLIIFEIDSPGGLLSVCEDLSQQISRLHERDIKTVAYIPRKAISGGAILAVACDEIYMHPTATIGNAIPIGLTGNMIVRAEEKILSMELRLLRDLAEQKKRPAAILESFADKDLEVFEVVNKTTGKRWLMSQEEIHLHENEWNAGPMVPETRKGSALIVNGIRANELFISLPPVQDQTELKERLGLPAQFTLRAAERTWVDTLTFILNQQFVTGFLFFLAIVFIYIELATMTGLFAILSALCFAVFFWSKVMGGTASGLEVAIFVVGMACLAMEIFVMPGFGVFGVSGILLVLASLIMASQTFSGFSLEYDVAQAGKTFATLGIAFLAMLVTSAVLSRYLHRLPLIRDLVITGPGGQRSESDLQLNPDLLNPEMALLGLKGEAATILRPAGKARINGQLHDVVSEGAFIEAGTEITVVQVQKNRIVVRQSLT